MTDPDNRENRNLSPLRALVSQAGFLENGKECQIRAKNDEEALQCWLDEYRMTPTTFRTYQKEGVRFLLWVVSERHKTLSTLHRDDLEAYWYFLDDPQPREKWCAKSAGRGCRRGDPGWRPFVGSLSATAKLTAFSSIDSCLTYLTEARYLDFNPLSLMRRRSARNRQLQNSEFHLAERMLTLEEWHAMLDTLEQFPEDTQETKFEKMRLTFLVKILYFLGLRINELATHTWNAFRKIEDEWWFYVRGKGNKMGRIPVNDELLRAIIIHRAYLKKSPYPDPNETTPLIVSQRGEAITTRHMNKILKKLALATAEQFREEPDKARKIRKFSPHWLRHLSASMQDRAGIQFKHIRANHRHENDETTRRYVHAIDRERHQDMQKLTLRINPA